MPGPKFSIVTASFNSIHTIRETIESVLSQDFKDWEHIVMDGGSKDGTLELLKEFPHLKWESEKDEGHYHAMNKGIERAQGEILLMLNADDCLRPGVLRKVAEAFDKHPEWDAAFGDIIYVDATGNEIYRREEARYDYDILRLSGVCYVIHQTLFVKKALHDRLGVYRHKDFFNCCDYEFILRMGREKAVVGHIPEYIVNYRYHMNGQSADLRVIRNMARESAIIRKEHGWNDGPLAPVVRAAMRGKRQLQKIIYRGKLDLVPGSWKTRRQMREKTDFTSNIPIGKT
ncbi:MAG TPA: glycosyltransferase family 2 protein [Verrucomicrobiae bacterium]|jgi:glycosyltransferase involved in cell wall biosynthesis